jgi:hypothetical protein
MGHGSSTTSRQLRLAPNEASQPVERTGNVVGKVVESLPTVGWVVVKARFGRQSVKVCISVTGDDGVSTVTFDRLVREIASSEPIECRLVVVVYGCTATVTVTPQTKEQHANSRHPS